VVATVRRRSPALALQLERRIDNLIDTVQRAMTSIERTKDHQS
jgi:hypothetical protein